MQGRDESSDFSDDTSFYLDPVGSDESSDSLENLPTLYVDPRETNEKERTLLTLFLRLHPYPDIHQACLYPIEKLSKVYKYLVLVLSLIKRDRNPSPKDGLHDSRWEVVDRNKFIPGGSSDVYASYGVLKENGIFKNNKARMVKKYLPGYKNSKNIKKKLLEKISAEHEFNRMMDYRVKPLVPLSDGSFALVLPYIPECDLSDLIHQLCWDPENYSISAATCFEIWMVILRAVEDMHKREIIHRDLKPENMRIAFDDVANKIVIKIIDFGIAKKIGENNSKKNKGCCIAGTPGYQSLRQISQEDPQPSDDFSALVEIFLQLLFHRSLVHLLDQRENARDVHTRQGIENNLVQNRAWGRKKICEQAFTFISSDPKEVKSIKKQQCYLELQILPEAMKKEIIELLQWMCSWGGGSPPLH